MDDQTTEIFNSLLAMYGPRALVAHLVGECGNLVYEASRELKSTTDPLALDYQLITAIASLELALELVRHNVLGTQDEGKLDLVRKARLIRMRQLTTPPIAP